MDCLAGCQQAKAAGPRVRCHDNRLIRAADIARGETTRSEREIDLTLPRIDQPPSDWSSPVLGEHIFPAAIHGAAQVCRSNFGIGCIMVIMVCNELWEI